MIEPAASQKYLYHLLRGDRRSCRAVVQGLLEQGVSPREFYVELFQASLYAVGERWQHGQLSVAMEHLATATTEEMLGLVFPTAVAQKRIGRTAVVSCAADEFHQVGGRIVADSIEAAGWHVHFLGANVPEDVVLAHLRDTTPDLLALSVTIATNLPVALRTVQFARAQASALRIIVGGQALEAGAVVAPFLAVRDVSWVRSLPELDAVLASWMA